MKISKKTRKRVLGSAVVITLFGVVPTVAIASQDGGEGLSARLEAGSASTWYVSGKFALANEAGTPQDKWKLEFDVLGGTFENHSAWNTDAVQTGGHVVLTPKHGHPVPAAGTQELLWGISGRGTAKPGIANCSLDGGAVTGCTSSGHDAHPPGHGDHASGHDDHAPVPSPDPPAEPPAPAPPAADGGDAPGTGSGPTGFAVGVTSRTDGGTTVRSLHMSWTAPDRTDAIQRYEVYVDGRLATTVYQKASGGKVEQTLPIGPTPATGMTVKVRSQRSDGRWSAFSPELTVAVR